MKKIILPLGIFILGLVIAQVYFDVDIERLAEGFFDFVKDLLDGPG